MRCLTLLMVSLCSIGAVAQERQVPRPSRESLVRTAKIDKQVTLDVTLIDAAPDDSLSALSGEELVAKLQELQKRKQTATASHFRLTTLDQSPATIQVGQQERIEVSRSNGRDGRPVSNFQYQNVGTLLSVVTQVSAEDTVLVDYVVERSRVGQPKQSDPVGENEEFTPAGIDTTTLKSTVSLRSGETQAVMGRQSSSDTQTWLLIKASIESLPKLPESPAAPGASGGPGSER